MSEATGKQATSKDTSKVSAGAAETGDKRPATSDGDGEHTQKKVADGSKTVTGGCHCG